MWHIINLHVLYLTCLYTCILASSYPHVRVHWLLSLHTRSLKFLCLCAPACILLSLHPRLLRLMCTCFHPCILISSGLRVLVCNLVSPHLLTLRLMYSVCLLASSHLHILITSSSSVCTCLGNWNQLKAMVLKIKMAFMETNNGSNKFLTK